MNINRHNYEEYFLLYVDNELSAADRKAVDVFVGQNPDLKIELVLLQQAVIKTDDVVLPKKDWLYREEEITALQENLLLYADNELTAEDNKQVESLIAADELVAAEWEILKQTKLQPDTTVVFDDKQLLYRKEAGRVVSFNWRQIAAAAVLLMGLFTGITVYLNSNKTSSTGQEVVQHNNKKINKAKATSTNTTGVKTSIDNPVVDLKATAVTNKATTGIKDINNNKVPHSLKIKNSATLPASQNMAIGNSSNKKPGNNLPKSYLENINNSTSNETMITAVTPESNNSKKVSGNNNAVVKPNAGEANMNTLIARNDPEKTNTTVVARQAVNKTSEEDNNSRYLNLDDDRERRTALGGFLRKAKRVLERTANMNTGEGIKIAGFEIALK